MKKMFALLLCLPMLLSMAACGNKNGAEEEKEKTISYYVVTSEKHYNKDELTSSAEFTYDSKGRPLTMKIEMAGKRTMETKLSYDKYGNKIRETYTYTELATGLTTTTDEIYELTYEGDKLTHCTITDQAGDGRGFDLRYDDQGRLVLVDYDEAYTQARLDLWHTYEYDDQGRLIKETSCKKRATGLSIVDASMVYSVVQMRYQYGKDDNVFYTEYTANFLEEVTPETLQEQALEKKPEQYNYCFDKDGKVIYVGADEEDVYKKEYGALQDDDRYTFDAHGNLLSYVNGEARVEYTYEKRELTRKEAEMANRLAHGASSFMTPYIIFGKLDPLYVDVAPVVYYTPYLRNPVYYLAPCPLWYMPKK